MDGLTAQRLVQRYADKILRISYSYLKNTCDAEDICQTVFLKYLTSGMEFESEAHEEGWIVRTTVNACKDHLRSAFFRRSVPLEEAGQLASPPPKEPDTDLAEAMKRLPESYRICLYLFYYEEYSAQEIGNLLGKSQSAVNQCLSRGRRKLRKYLTEGAQDNGT